jgi:hypothetical protein
MYNQDGYMFVAIMGSNRLKFAAEDLLSGPKRRKPQVCHSALPLFVFYIEDDVLSGSRS